MLIQHSVHSDWLLNTQSSALEADWLILGNNEMATLDVNISYKIIMGIHYEKSYRFQDYIFLNYST